MDITEDLHTNKLSVHYEFLVEALEGEQFTEVFSARICVTSVEEMQY